MTTESWPTRFARWQTTHLALQQRAREIEGKRRERAYKLAESHGLPRHAGMIHNARCDTKLQDWCKDNPARLAAAETACRMLQDYRASHAADRMQRALWVKLGLSAA